MNTTQQQPTPVYNSKVSLDDSILSVCELWANNRSKDPNTKVGCAVYDPITGGLFLGYNGFPKGVPDTVARWDNRDKDSPDCKYRFVVHAEKNALRKASMALGENVSRCHLYVTHKPCSACMLDIASYGIRRVVFMWQHWNDPISDKIAEEVGIELRWSGP